jgi:hypothetical protein
MNQQALSDAYKVATMNGYKRDINSFYELLSTNSEALNDMYQLALKNGYKKPVDDFKSLLGIGAMPIQTSKKKEQFASSAPGKGTESAGESSSLGLLSDDPFRLKQKTKFKKTLEAAELGLSPVELSMAEEEGADLKEFAERPIRELPQRQITIGDKAKDFKLTPDLYAKNKEKIDAIILPPEAKTYLSKNEIPFEGAGMYKGGKTTDKDLERKLKAWYALNPAGQREYKFHEDILKEGEEIISAAEKRLDSSIEMERAKWSSEIAASANAGFQGGISTPRPMDDPGKIKPLRLRVLEAEKEKVKEARKALDTYKDSKTLSTAQQVWNQVGRLSGETVEDIVTFGITPLMKDLTFLEIKQKEDRGEKLTDAEKEMQRTGAYSRYVVDTFAGESSFGQDAVSAVMHSLPYMVSYATLGGAIAKPILKTSTGAVRAGVRLAALQGTEVALARATGSATTFGLNVANKLIGVVGKRPAALMAGVVDEIAGAGVRTIVDPRTYNKVIENVTGNYGYAVDDKGRVTYTGMEGDMNFPQALTNAYTRQMVENLSEATGQIFPVVGRAMRGKIPAIAKLMRGPKFTGTTKKFMDAAGFNGMPAEFFEEQIATIGHSLTKDGDGQWSDLIDPRQQLLTLVTVAAIGSGAAMASGVEREAKKKITSAAFNYTVKNLRQEFGDDYVEIGKSLTTHGVNANMASLNDIIVSEDYTDSQKKAALDYYVAGNRYFAYRANEDARDKDMTEEEKLMRMRNERILDNVVSANKNISYTEAVNIANAEIELKDLEGNTTETANLRRAELKNFIGEKLGAKPAAETTTTPEQPAQAPVRTTEEILAALEQNMTDLNAAIEAYQAATGQEIVPISISEDTEVTLDRLDNNEPVTNEFIKKASDELYAAYKELEAMKSADVKALGERKYTDEQIESMQEFIGEEITKLEEYATRQKEEGKFVNEIENRPTAEGRTEEVVKPEKVKENAVQKPESESAVPSEKRPEVGLPEVGEGNEAEKPSEKSKKVKPKEIENPLIRKALLESMRLTFPDVDVIISTEEEDGKERVREALIKRGATEEEAEEALKSMTSERGAVGFVNGKPAVLHLNESLMTERTFGHEFWHLILNDAFGQDKKLFQRFKNSIDKALRANGYSAVADKLTQFSNQYEQEDSFEEYIAELGGLLTAEGIEPENMTRAQKSLMGKIKELINKFAERIVGIKVFDEKNATDQDVLEFVMSVSEAMKRGEQISIGKKTAKPDTGVMTKEQKTAKDEYVETLRAKLREAMRGVTNYREAVKPLWKLIREDLDKLVNSGDITQKQVVRILNKYNNTNLLSQKSTDNFIAYVDKIFKDAEFAEKLEGINAKREKAKSNAREKLGDDLEIVELLLKVLSVNAEMIPDNAFETYNDIVQKIGANKKVIQPGDRAQLKEDIMDVMKAVVEEHDKVETLSMLFNEYDRKVYDSEGKLDYAATLSRMNEVDKNGVQLITKEEYDLMKKHKKRILTSYMEYEGIEDESDKRSKEEKDAEKEALRKALIKQNSSIEVDVDNLLGRDQRNAARELLKLRLDKKILERLSVADLKVLADVMENIKDGFFAHSAEKMLEKLEQWKQANDIYPVVFSTKLGIFSDIRGSLRALSGKDSKFFYMLESNPLGIIDEVFGNFNSRELFKAFISKLASGFATYKSQYDVIQKMLDKNRDALAASVKGNHNKAVERQFFLMAYALQREYETNEGNPQVSNAVKIIEKTMSVATETPGYYDLNDVAILADILEKYSDGKNLDSKKMHAAMSPVEKELVDVIMPKMREALAPKASFVSGVIREQALNPINNYIHHMVLGGGKESSDRAMQNKALSDVEKFMNAVKPSTKSKALTERDGDVHPLMFNIYSALSGGAKSVLIDYHLTRPARVSSGTIKNLLNILENEIKGQRSQNQMIHPDAAAHAKRIRELIGSIDKAIDSVTRNVLTSAWGVDTAFDRAVNEIEKQGYRAILASPLRMIQETLSNAHFALLYPDVVAAGMTKENMDYIFTEKGRVIMENVLAANTNRVYTDSSFTGRFIEPGAGGAYYGIKQAKTKSTFSNAVVTMHNFTTKRIKSGVDVIADTLITTPDKPLARLMWQGSFDIEFKKRTGKLPDKEKLFNNDEGYMEEYSVEIEAARDHADLMSIRSSGTANPFLGIMKTTMHDPSNHWFKQFWKKFDSFLLNFQIYEYTAVRAGFMKAMTGYNAAERANGARLMAAAFSRSAMYVTYGLIIRQVFDSILGAAMGYDDDEDDKKTLRQMFEQGFANGMIAMIFGRNMGNLWRGLINYPIERVNEKYLSERFAPANDPEYDMYRDALTFSYIPTGDLKGKEIMWEMIVNMLGPLSPHTRTVGKAVQKGYYLSTDDKKDEKAVERAKRDLMIRVPIETLGNLGYLPFYRDVRKAVNAYLYQELKYGEKLTPSQEAYYEAIGGKDWKKNMKEAQARMKKLEKEAEERAKNQR